MTGRRASLAVFLLALAVVGLRIALPGLSDPSEGRYTQIAWEMTERGDWLVPHWNGVPHLEKPPLAYWAGAVGLELFGRNEFGVRFLPALALLLTAWLTAGMARRIHGRETATAAFAAMALSAYPVATGAALLTDVFDLLAATLFFHSIVRRLSGESERVLGWAIAGLAIGMLSKGYTIFLFTLAPLLIARRDLFRELFRRRRLALLALLVLPWFVAVSLRYPDFASVHLGKLVDFVGSNRQHHRAPFFIYFAALLAGLFPFVLWLRPGAAATRPPFRRLLGAWLVLPFVVLTLLPSRSWTYILPATPAIALFAAKGLCDLPRFRWLDLVYPFAVAVGFGIAGAVAPAGTRVHQFQLLLFAVAAAMVAAGLLFLAERRRAFHRTLAAAAAAGLATLVFVYAATHLEARFRIHRELARAVEREAGRTGPVFVVADKLPSLPFYLGRPVTVVALRDRVAEEAERWGGSSFFLPDVEPETFLTAPVPGTYVVPENLRAAIVPSWRPVFRQDGRCVLVSPPGAR